MKKVILAAIAVLGFTVSGIAQEGAKKPALKSDVVVKQLKKDSKSAEATKEVHKDLTTGAAATDPKKQTKNEVAKGAKHQVKAANTKATDTKVVLKKDGTPDKRYKEAKEVVLKKDGTPDKRYKQK